MTDVTVPWPELRADFEQAAKRFDALVDGADNDRNVEGTDWTVHETVVHTINTIDRWRAAARGARLGITPGAGFGARMAELNRAEIDATPADLGTAAAAAERWLAIADPDTTMHPWGLADYECTAAHATGILLGEVLVHGHDLARTLGAPWSISRREAIATFDGVISVLPALYRGAATEGQAFDMDLRIRGRIRGIGLRCTPERLTVSEGSPPRADVHVSAEPVAWLLVGYGRTSRTTAALTGKFVIWGRKPWLATTFGQLIEPV